MIAPIADQPILVIVHAWLSEREQESTLNFDLNAILNRTDEMQDAMTPMEEEEPLPNLLPASGSTPVTPEAIEAFEPRGESTLVMAEFRRSILSGTHIRLTDLLDIREVTHRPMKKYTRKKEQPI